MAKIVIAFDSTYGDTYFRGFADSLCAFGNDIFYVNLHNLQNIHGLYDKIKKFDCDVLFSFNNFFPDTREKSLYEKIVIIDTDTPSNFINKEQFLNNYNAGKYYYASIQSCFKLLLNEHFPNISDFKNAFWFPPATTFKHRNEHYERNILFVGTNWNYDLYKIFPSIDACVLKHLFSKVKENYFFDIEEELKRIGYRNSLLSNFNFKWNIAGLQRIEYLSMLTDLGLEIYGDRWNLLAHNMDVLNAVTNEKILSPTKLNHLYNTSKICVNFSHPQAITGFSFRNMDIMASSSCILTEKKSDFEELFGEFISEEVKQTILYVNKFDMREKAKLLLNNEELRLKCVRECNYAISRNGRWQQRIKILEKALNVSLHSINKGSFFNYTENAKPILNQANNAASSISNGGLFFQRAKSFIKRHKKLVFLLLLAEQLVLIGIIAFLFFKTK